VDYKYAVQKANEAALKENLFQMRNLLQQYFTDKHKYPISLQTLVDEKYLLKIPIDPMTKSTETWIEIQETLLEDDLLEGVIPGIADVKSGSNKKAIDETNYNTW